jgi:small acid-soluble spore protein H (minor)
MIKEKIIMNKERAQEIVSSPIMANVTLNGTPIYIESVNANTETASIHFLNNPKNSQEVALTNLQEHQK